MRSILVLLMLAAVPLAQAQTSGDRAYVAARGQAGAGLETRYKSLPRPIGETAWGREAQAVEGELKARLQGVMARFPLPKGSSVIGFHPDPVCCSTAAGALDGLLLSNGRIRAVATTEGILQLWLGGRDPRAALERDDIGHLRALNADAAVRIFAPLPVATPPRRRGRISRLRASWSRDEASPGCLCTSS
ncbi:hypothetical protein [Reyranella sp.]|uniref:hypothetical protein n=1 Tax=Reyranella sp. TaxID=1929291 RepID=UPI003D140520